MNTYNMFRCIYIYVYMIHVCVSVQLVCMWVRICEYVYVMRICLYLLTGLLEGPIRKLHCIQQIDPPPGADVAQAAG